MTGNVLRVDASMRVNGSVSRQVVSELIDRLTADRELTVVERDLSRGVPLVDEAWINANFTDPDARSDAQKQALAESDALVQELQGADTVVIGLPIYNFGVPAAFKAWVDMITRARQTFRYTPDGPQGLLTGKRVYVVMTSGGTALGSEFDFASGYVRKILAFNGMTDVEFIDATRTSAGAGQVMARAKAQIDALIEAHRAAG